MGDSEDKSNDTDEVDWDNTEEIDLDNDSYYKWSQRTNADDQYRRQFLLDASPEYVAGKLEEYAVVTTSIKDRPKHYRYFNTILYREHSYSYEKPLLARNKRLINLALAKYGRDSEVIRDLYERSCSVSDDASDHDYFKSLRLSCLSNPEADRLGYDIGDNFYARLFARDSDGSYVEAYFSNPYVHDMEFARLFKREQNFSDLDDECFEEIISVALDNPKFIGDKEHVAQALNDDLHAGILHLLETLPVTKGNLQILYWFISRINPFTQHYGTFSPIESIVPILDRWDGLKSELPQYGEEDYDITQATLIDFRVKVATIYGFYRNEKNNFNKKIIGSPRSHDIALRCAYYGHANLSRRQIRRGFHKDWALYLDSVLCNEYIMRFPSKEMMYLVNKQCSSIDGYNDEFERRQDQFANADIRPESWSIVSPDDPSYRSINDVYRLLKWWLIIVIAALVLHHYL